jgi:hypothetical protein
MASSSSTCSTTRRRRNLVIAAVLDRRGRQRPAQRHVQCSQCPSISLNVQIRARNPADIAGASEPPPVMERTIPSSPSPIKASLARPENPRTLKPLHFSSIYLYLSNASVNCRWSRRRTRRLGPFQQPRGGRGGVPRRVYQPGGVEHPGEQGGGLILKFPFIGARRKSSPRAQLRPSPSSSSILSAMW